MSLCQNSLDLPSVDSYIDLEIVSLKWASVIAIGYVGIINTWWKMTVACDEFLYVPISKHLNCCVIVFSSQ